MSPSQHKKQHLEFGGPVGAAFMVVGLPAAILIINLTCNKDTCDLLHLPSLPTWSELFNARASLIYLGWFIFQILLHCLPVGSIAYGLPLASGKKLEYRCNGFIALIISVTGFGVLVSTGVPVNFLYRQFLALSVFSIIFSFILAIFLYIKSFTVKTDELAIGGNSGYFIYDFFIGRELNPRIGGVDLKFFCELRPGLIGWVLLDLSFIVEALSRNSSDQILAPLVLVTGFHALYVADALWHEEAILTTMDIVHDGFGLMLVFGDLAWVPFLYCLQARYILEHPQQWSMLALGAILLLNIVGFVIFRGSNSQKNAFRKNPNDPKLKYLKTLSTSSGRKLLTSGWWGLSRHPNYMGDLIMALSWSLITGFQNIIPYFYPLYFLGLLIHRSLRDDAQCRLKYGRDWNEYCKQVPYRIFPYIY